MAVIADAVKTLEELIAALDDAYWESGSIEQKDRIFDLVGALYRELSELGKLSIQDHDLEYEPVNAEFRVAKSKLSALRRSIDESVLRSSTAIRLEAVISAAVALSEH